MTELARALAQALAQGELRVLGRLPDASNLALLCEVDVGAQVRRCVYKPQSGERPLWDFPDVVLGRREVLTAAVAACFGWDVVPTTVWRSDGPRGAGMCQEWIEDPGPAPVRLFREGQVPDGWCGVAEGRSSADELVVLAHEDSADLRRIVVLDDLVNNADRKGGHVLRRGDGRLAGIDHGVSFHAQPKLRTVLWGWAGQRLRSADRRHLEQLAECLAPQAPLPGTLRELLTGDEIEALRRRVARLLREGRHPHPSPGWPSVPWPAL